NDIQEIWEVSYIGVSPLKSEAQYVIILIDSSLICTCMKIINQGMPCRHQYRIFLQSNKAVFHLGLIHTRWFESMPSETLNYIIISQGTKSFTTNPLHYIDNIRARNVYTPTTKNKVDKRIEFGATMSIARTSIQVAVAEGVTAELTGLLTQFLMKYRLSTGLNIEEVYQSTPQSNEIQESSLIVVNNERSPLIEEDNNQHKPSSSKTCGY
ncbi:24214_t:CDS:2, partial [Gigaspora margarita]